MIKFCENKNCQEMFIYTSDNDVFLGYERFIFCLECKNKLNDIIPKRNILKSKDLNSYM